jgi:hypothetical protein
MADTDDLAKGEALTEATTHLEDLILSSLIVRAIEKAEAAGEDVVDYLKTRLPLLVKSAGAARAAADHLAKASAPAVLVRQALEGRAAAAAEQARRAAWTREMDRRQDVRLAREQAEKSAAGLAKAERELAAAQRRGDSDREILLLEGAQALWQDRVAKSTANLAEVEKRGTP